MDTKKINELKVELSIPISDEIFGDVKIVVNVEREDGVVIGKNLCRTQRTNY